MSVNKIKVIPTFVGITDNDGDDNYDDENRLVEVEKEHYKKLYTYW